MGFFDLSLLDAYVHDNSPAPEEKSSQVVRGDDCERNYWEPAPLNFLDSSQDGLPRPFKWKMEDECGGKRQIASKAVSSSKGVLQEGRGEATTPRNVRSRSGDAILSREQCEVMELVLKGENVFFTGPGGTGKSFVLKCVIETLKDKFSDPHSPAKSFAGTCGCFSCNVAVTASTGIAALAIGGSTLHSAAGIGIPRRIRDFGRMFHTELRAKWRRLKVLIIDEVSMISAETLEYLEQTLCRLREVPENEISSNQSPSPVLEPRPFGGLQVILAGDFFQLLPVVLRDYPGKAYCWDELTNRGIAFQAPAWHKGNFRTIFLTKAFRQDREDEFVTLLEDIRTGRHPASVDKIVRDCERMLPYQHGIKPTKLFPRSLEVKELNDNELARLCSREEVFVSIDSYDTVETSVLSRKDSSQPDTSVLELHDMHKGILEGHIFWKYCQAERIVRLKVGAQVMLLRNLRRPRSRLTLVNGSRGVIVGWTTKEKALADLRKRAKDPFGPNKFEYESVKTLEKCDLFVIPRVKFRNGEILDILPMTFDHEVVNVGECRRIQIPLKLAWAITIHKSQGMTLDYAKVALSGVFAEGQAYVALSRVKSMDSLQVLNTNSVRSVVRVNKLVKAYFEDIQNGTGEKPKTMRFRTIKPLYTGRKKSDNSKKEASDDSIKELGDRRSVHAKNSLNAGCQSTDGKVLQKVDQHQASPSGRIIPPGTCAAVADEDQKSQNLFGRVKTENNDMCVTGDAFLAHEVVMSPVQLLNKTSRDAGCRYLASSVAKSPTSIQTIPSDADLVKKDSGRVTDAVGRNDSLPTGFKHLSLGNGESMPVNISRNVSGLAKEMQGVLDLYEEKPLCASRRTEKGMLPDRLGKITNKEDSRKVSLMFGRIKLEQGIIELAQPKADTRTNKRQAHTEFTNQNSRPYYYPQRATGSRTESAAHSHRSGEAGEGKRDSFSVAAVKFEPKSPVPEQRGQVMDDNVSSRSDRRSRGKRRMESTEFEENGRPRKHVKKPRVDSKNLVKGKYPRKLGSTAKSPRQTQTVDVNDVPGVPRETSPVSLNPQRAPGPWSRIETAAEECVCYFCNKEGHFASDCNREGNREVFPEAQASVV